MPASIDLAGLADGLFNTARRLLRQDSHLAPLAFVVRGDGRVETVALRFDSPAGKERAYARLTSHCRDVSATAVICINESWLVERPLRSGMTPEEVRREAEAGVPPSRDPERVEALTMFVLGPGFKPTMRLVPFTRRRRRIVFGIEREQKLIDEISVLMIPRWWDPEVNFSRQ